MESCCVRYFQLNQIKSFRLIARYIYYNNASFQIYCTKLQVALPGSKVVRGSSRDYPNDFALLWDVM